MKFIVPSTKRAHRIHPLPWLPRSSTTIVVPEDEVDNYARVYPKWDIAGCPVKRIAPTRQWVIENYDDEVIFFVDDDLVFFERDSQGKLHRLEDPKEMWHTVERTFSPEYPFVSVSIRLGNNFVKEDYKDNVKCCNLWGVMPAVLHKNNIRIDRTPVMEDYQVILSLLSLGYKNRVWFKWAADWRRISNTDGGCSTWRTSSVQAEGARALKKLFPDFVTLQRKSVKAGWFDDQQERVDVRVQWKQAFKSGSFLR